MRGMKDRGYKFVHLRSGYAVTAKNRFADWDINCGGWDEFGRVLAGTTALAAVVHFPGHRRADPRQDLVLLRDARADSAPCRGSTICLRSFRAPGATLALRRETEKRSSRSPPTPTSSGSRSLSTWTSWSSQVGARSRRSIAILAKSETPPIIVLQSDHGSASSGYRWLYAREGPPPTGNEPGIDVLFRERTEILSAFLMPGGAPELYPSISPVNSFRVVFNRFFGERYPLLEDRTFFSRYSSPYQLLDVTARVSAPVGLPGP